MPISPTRTRFRVAMGLTLAATCCTFAWMVAGVADWLPELWRDSGYCEVVAIKVLAIVCVFVSLRIRLPADPTTVERIGRVVVICASLLVFLISIVLTGPVP